MTIVCDQVSTPAFTSQTTSDRPAFIVETFGWMGQDSRRKKVFADYSDQCPFGIYVEQLLTVQGFPGPVPGTIAWATTASLILMGMELGALRHVLRIRCDGKGELGSLQLHTLLDVQPLMCKIATFLSQVISSPKLYV